MQVRKHPGATVCHCALAEVMGYFRGITQADAFVLQVDC